MKYLIAFFFLLLGVIYTGYAQYEYDVTSSYPFGQPNPDAAQELLDFAPLIGSSNCKSISRKADGTWRAPIEMIWRFKYILNGMAIQDETLKADGSHSGSIRQFVQDSSKWYVHYYANNSLPTQLPAWEGNKQGDSIVLYREQKAPNGTDGYYRLTFNNISEKGFTWVGEWVNVQETFTYPTWKINCIKDEEY